MRMSTPSTDADLLRRKRRLRLRMGRARRRIDRRVERMFDQGLVDETRRLMQEGLGDNRLPLQAIGYRQVVEHLRGRRIDGRVVLDDEIVDRIATYRAEYGAS